MIGYSFNTMSFLYYMMYIDYDLHQYAVSNDKHYIISFPFP